MCTPQVKDAVGKFSEDTKSAGKEYARRMEAEKGRVEDTNVTGAAMEKFEGGMTSLSDAGNVIGSEVQRWGDTAAGLLGMGKQESQEAVSDTASANYSKSSSEQSSKTKSKAKKKGGEGTGGSKSQFYAKK